MEILKESIKETKIQSNGSPFLSIKGTSFNTILILHFPLTSCRIRMRQGGRIMDWGVFLNGLVFFNSD